MKKLRSVSRGQIKQNIYTISSALPSPSHVTAFFQCDLPYLIQTLGPLMHSDLDPIHSLIQLSKDRDDINLLPNQRTQNKQNVNHDKPLWTLEPPNIVSGVRCGNALRISLVALNTLLFQRAFSATKCAPIRSRFLDFLGNRSGPTQGMMSRFMSPVRRLVP